MNKNTAYPRALRGSVHAESGPADMIRQLNSAFNDFKTSHQAELRDIEASLNEKIAGAHMTSSERSSRPVDPAYTQAFASYFRKGDGELELRQANESGQRAQINAAMTVGTADSGGYLAPTEWDRKVQQALIDTSPMRRLASVQSTSVGAYSTLWNNNSWGSGWVGETAARPETTSATLEPVEFASGEIYAMPAVTQRLLDDAELNLDNWLTEQVQGEFGRQESIAFISGNGTNKPRGLLSYVTGGASDNVHPGGNLSVDTMASATAITADEIVDFTYALPAPYRQNATWLMNSATAATISKLKNTDGDYIWREGLLVGQPATLLGRPVEIDEGMPDIAAGTLPIAFGDFRRGYLINDRLGTRVLRDPFTNKPFVNFYCTKRVGAGVLDPNAIRLLQMAAA